MGNTPPTLQFEPNGPIYTGPPKGTATSYTAVVGEPLTLIAWITDKPAKFATAPLRTPQRGGAGGPGGRGQARPDLLLTWILHRGPADVTFSKPKPDIDKANGGKTTTTATFSAPGDYILRAQPTTSRATAGAAFSAAGRTRT
jgi:hypothetical protein